MPEPWSLPDPPVAQSRIVLPPEPDYLLWDAPDRDRAHMHRLYHEDHPERPCEQPDQPVEVPGWRSTLRRLLHV